MSVLRDTLNDTLKDTLKDSRIYFNPEELRTKEFNRLIDSLLTHGEVMDEDWAILTPVQKHIYSVINRAMKRVIKRLSNN